MAEWQKVNFYRSLITSDFLNNFQDFAMDVAEETNNARFLMFLDDDINPVVGTVEVYQYPEFLPGNRVPQIYDMFVARNGAFGKITSITYEENDPTIVLAATVATVSAGNSQRAPQFTLFDGGGAYVIPPVAGVSAEVSMQGAVFDGIPYVVGDGLLDINTGSIGVVTEVSGQYCTVRGLGINLYSKINGQN